jgi:hypothetical protein
VEVVALVEIVDEPGLPLLSGAFGSSPRRSASWLGFPARDFHAPPDPELRIITYAGQYSPAPDRYLATLVIFAVQVALT